MVPNLGQANRNISLSLPNNMVGSGPCSEVLSAEHSEPSAFSIGNTESSPGEQELSLNHTPEKSKQLNNNAPSSDHKSRRRKARDDNGGMIYISFKVISFN